MKVVVFANSRAVAAKGAEPEIILGADSAILRPGEPVFLANDSSVGASRIVPAVRIGRLGTHIPFGAADAYIDAHTLIHLLVPQGDEAVPPTLWGISDRTFSPGKWLDGTLPDRPYEVKLEVAPLEKPDNSRLQTLLCTLTRQTAGACVAAISKYCTLKTGDILLLADCPLEAEVMPDTLVAASLTNQKVLDLKIK